ncbi:hypothetical protein AJ80_06311 [Polytolypa hystricis UAMH7299]|uniref:Uncharacterized protein n=1 Tax=Polytolypa hystricis (strain UAMH7299) TaxID=1447883 RepID=A0A2B7XXU7_POLH7|nr:hypothetical protein AJ80_06311 [Polytolypa hystricis UAMH7299]
MLALSLLCRWFGVGHKAQRRVCKVRTVPPVAEKEVYDIEWNGDSCGKEAERGLTRYYIAKTLPPMFTAPKSLLEKTVKEQIAKRLVVVQVVSSYHHSRQAVIELSKSQSGLDIHTSSGTSRCSVDDNEMPESRISDRTSAEKTQEAVELPVPDQSSPQYGSLAVDSPRDGNYPASDSDDSSEYFEARTDFVRRNYLPIAKAGDKHASVYEMFSPIPLDKTRFRTDTATPTIRSDKDEDDDECLVGAPAPRRQFITHTPDRVEFVIRSQSDPDNFREMAPSYTFGYAVGSNHDTTRGMESMDTRVGTRAGFNRQQVKPDFGDTITDRVWRDPICVADSRYMAKTPCPQTALRDVTSISPNRSVEARRRDNSWITRVPDRIQLYNRASRAKTNHYVESLQRRRKHRLYQRVETGSAETRNGAVSPRYVKAPGSGTNHTIAYLQAFENPSPAIEGPRYIYLPSYQSMGMLGSGTTHTISCLQAFENTSSLAIECHQHIYMPKPRRVGHLSHILHYGLTEETNFTRYHHRTPSPAAPSLVEVYDAPFLLRQITWIG